MIQWKSLQTVWNIEQKQKISRSWSQLEARCFESAWDKSCGGTVNPQWCRWHLFQMLCVAFATAYVFFKAEYHLKAIPFLVFWQWARKPPWNPLVTSCYNQSRRSSNNRIWGSSSTSCQQRQHNRISSSSRRRGNRRCATSKCCSFVGGALITGLSKSPTWISFIWGVLGRKEIEKVFTGVGGLFYFPWIFFPDRCLDMFFDDFFTDSIPWDENHHENPTIWENIFWFTFSIRIEEFANPSRC